MFGAVALAVALVALAGHSYAGAAQLLVMFAIAIPWIVNRRPHAIDAQVLASHEGIRIGDKLYPRESIKSSLVVHEALAPYARFEMPWFSRLDLRVADDAQAAALFTALGVDAMSSTTEVTLFSANKWLQYALLIPFTLVALLMTVGRSALGIHPGATMPVMMVALVLPFVWMMNRMRRTKFLIGADGIRITEGMNRPVFYAHDRIDDVDANDHYVTITLKSGERKSFVTTLAKNPGAEHTENAHAIVRRIRAAREAHAMLDATPDDALALARGDRTHDAWVAALKRIGQGADATFRQIAMPREALLRLVESTRASATERLAAIVALRSSMTEDEAPRVRVAVDRCAEIALRDRMRVVIDGDDESTAARVLADAEAEQAAEEAQDADDAERRKHAS